MPHHPQADPEAGNLTFAWGSVGTSSPVLQNGQVIVRREVEPDVDYHEPPPDLVPFWRTVLGESRQFLFVPEHGDYVQQFETLDRLGLDLRSAPAKSPEDPRLQRLEAAVDALIRLVQGLHDNGWGVGLLHPGNVLVAPGSSPKVILVDLGFVSVRGLITPRWLQSEFAPLWDRDPADQQIAQPDSDLQLAADSFDPRPDVRTLARLLNHVLTGRLEKIVTLPPKPVPPGSKGSLPAPRAPSKWDNLWSFLSQSSRDGQSSAAEFGRLLGEVGLRNHFFPPMPRTPRGGQLVAFLAAVILLIVVTAGAIWISQRPRPLGNGKPDQVEKYKQEFATATLQGKSKLVEEIQRLSPDPAHGQKTAEPFRRQVIADLFDRARKIVEALRQEQSLENYQALVAVHRELAEHLGRMKTLPADESLIKEEQECLAYVQTFSAQLGWEP